MGKRANIKKWKWLLKRKYWKKKMMKQMKCKRKNTIWLWHKLTEKRNGNGLAGKHKERKTDTKKKMMKKENVETDKMQMNKEKWLWHKLTEKRNGNRLAG